MADAEYKRLGCAADGCGNERQSLGLCAMHYRRLKRHGTTEDLAAQACENCAAVFQPTQRGAMYCSKLCKQHAWREKNPDRLQELKDLEAIRRAPPPKSKVASGYCGRCAEPFVIRQALDGFCSTECRRRAASEYALQRGMSAHQAAATEVSCRDCGGTFCPLYGFSHAKLCAPCAQESKRQAMRASRLAGKMRLRTQTVESVNPIKVFDRDGWTCQLCRIKTPRRLRGTADARAPELDHIHPVSLGGDHSYLNTQCACRACNGAKSNKPLGQMLLVG